MPLQREYSEGFSTDVDTYIERFTNFDRYAVYYKSWRIVGFRCLILMPTLVKLYLEGHAPVIVPRYEYLYVVGI